MGKLEHKLAKQERWGKVEKSILSAVGVVGLLAVSAIAPNALQLLGRFGTRRKRSSNKGWIAASTRRLIEKGALEYVAGTDSGKVRLTLKGEMVVRALEEHTAKHTRPKRWDGKWRVVIFDIAEGRRGARNKLRETLIAIGFVRLQNSVWVYPYDCEDLIALLKTNYKLGKEILYIIAHSIENDTAFRKRFNLPMVETN